MKRIFFILFTLFYVISFGQVNITTKATKQVEELPFDTSKNWQGEQYKSYFGQMLYVVPKHKMLEKYGYKDFYETPGGETFRPIAINSGNTKYEELVSKTYKVEDAILEGKDFMGNPNVYLKLSLDSQIVYYKYDMQYDNGFPFIVLSYLDKLKKDNIGKKFVLIKSADSKLSDYETGKDVILNPGTIWTCKDIVLDSEYYKLIMLFVNEKGETINDGVNGYLFFSYEEKKRLESKYGKDLVKTAIERKIKVGMTKELVRIAYGDPKQINTTSYNEQWVYSYGYVYFKNGKVTSWN